MILVSIIYSYVFEEIIKIKVSSLKRKSEPNSIIEIRIYLFIFSSNTQTMMKLKKEEEYFSLFIFILYFFQLITSVAYLTYFKIQVYYIFIIII